MNFLLNTPLSKNLCRDIGDIPYGGCRSALKWTGLKEANFPILSTITTWGLITLYGCGSSTCSLLLIAGTVQFLHVTTMKISTAIAKSPGRNLPLQRNPHLNTIFIYFKNKKWSCTRAAAITPPFTLFVFPFLSSSPPSSFVCMCVVMIHTHSPEYSYLWEEGDLWLVWKWVTAEAVTI